MVEHKDILAIVLILRSLTKIVKIFPFVYALVYIATMICYYCFSDSVATTLDLLFYMSPLTILSLVLLSFNLKLCNWHRLQCCLPLYPITIVFIDEYIISLSRFAVGNLIATVLLFFITSLINAYFVFIKPSASRS